MLICTKLLLWLHDRYFSNHLDTRTIVSVEGAEIEKICKLYTGVNLICIE